HLEHGDFGEWLQEHVEVAGSQARRYLRLAKHRQRLEELCPNWVRELTITEAIDLLAKPRATPVDRMTSDPRSTAPPRGTAGDRTTSAKQPDEAEIDPEAVAKLLKDAKTAHRERLKRLPELVRALGFFDGSPELGALRGLQQAFAASCYRFAEGIFNVLYESRGIDREEIALGLAAKF